MCVCVRSKEMKRRKGLYKQWRSSWYEGHAEPGLQAGCKESGESFGADAARHRADETRRFGAGKGPVSRITLEMYGRKRKGCCMNRQVQQKMPVYLCQRKVCEV